MNTKRITTEIAQAADAICAGQLVAVPTETVYGLAGNGLDPDAVAQIYEVKGRPAVKPLSLMVHDASAMARYSGVLLVTTMPAPCWTATSSLPANEGLGSTFRLISWLSMSLTCTCLGKKVALELEPT